MGHLNLSFSLYRCSLAYPLLVMTQSRIALRTTSICSPAIVVEVLNLGLQYFSLHFPLDGDRPRQGDNWVSDSPLSLKRGFPLVLPRLWRSNAFSHCLGRKVRAGFGSHNIIAEDSPYLGMWIWRRYIFDLQPPIHHGTVSGVIELFRH